MIRHIRLSASLLANCAKKAAFLAILACVLVANTTSQAAEYTVGIEFVDAAHHNPLRFLHPIDNIFPFQFTDPDNYFMAHGALDGYTEEEVRQEIVDAVQQIFRRAEINLPGRMLDVEIRMGAVSSEVGTTHSIGAAGSNIGLFGNAYPTGATFRPDLAEDPAYTNQLSITYADVVDLLPEFSPGTEFLTLENVVQSIAGTTAQEIAHTLNVWNDVPANPQDGIYPIMASGPTGLQINQRIHERRFLDTPATQPSSPGPPPSNDRVFSVPETLLNTAGTTFVSDFNFDGIVDDLDLSVIQDNVFQHGTGVATGDANDDGVTDVLDFNIWNEQREQSLLGPLADQATDEIVSFDAETGELSILADANVLTVVAKGEEPETITNLDEVLTEYANGSQQWWNHGTFEETTVSLATYDLESVAPIDSVTVGFVDGSQISINIVPEPDGLAIALIALFFPLYLRRRAR